MQVPVFNMQGKQVSTIEIDASALGGEVNPALIKQAYVMYHANLRQGSARTKSRGMVEGSTRKLFKQKHTGNARMGPARTPMRRGGGHAFAKTRTREAYHLDMPIKMRRRANRNALLAKLLDNEVKVIDGLKLAEPRTRAFKDLLEAVGINRSCLVALPEDNTNARLSARNLDGVTVCNSRQLTCFEMLNHRYMVIAREDLEAWIAGPSSQVSKATMKEAV
ncbi:MAG: 50S ribosomal protein L4 [Planctomycetota bacterium]|nr:50S ribosomal protein L4 [Planctomycetota bacterium]